MKYKKVDPGSRLKLLAIFSLFYPTIWKTVKEFKKRIHQSTYKTKFPIRKVPG